MLMLSVAFGGGNASVSRFFFGAPSVVPRWLVRWTKFERVCVFCWSAMYSKWKTAPKEKQQKWKCTHTQTHINQREKKYTVGKEESKMNLRTHIVTRPRSYCADFSFVVEKHYSWYLEIVKVMGLC